MHRVPQPDTWTGNGHRRQLNPIVCKFTRRMIRDTVLASRGNASRLTTDDLDLPFTAEINRIAIYSHLTLRLQELLHSAKTHQNTYNHKWCWAKGASIFLRKTDPSMTIRLGLIDDLTKLTLRQLPLQKRVYLFVEGRGSRVEGSMSRARVPRRGSRVTYFFPIFFFLEKVIIDAINVIKANNKNLKNKWRVNILLTEI